MRKKASNKTDLSPAEMDGFEKTARENLTHLSAQRLKRFLEEGHSLRRNLALRKQQQLLRSKKDEK